MCVWSHTKLGISVCVCGYCEIGHNAKGNGRTMRKLLAISSQISKQIAKTIFLHFKKGLPTSLHPFAFPIHTHIELGILICCYFAGPTCRYTKGSWTECDAKTNMRTRTLNLKKGESNCQSTRTVQKKCKKGEQNVR